MNLQVDALFWLIDLGIHRIVQIENTSALQCWQTFNPSLIPATFLRGMVCTTGGWEKLDGWGYTGEFEVIPHLSPGFIEFAETKNSHP